MLFIAQYNKIEKKICKGKLPHKSKVILQCFRRWGNFVVTIFHINYKSINIRGKIVCKTLALSTLNSHKSNNYKSIKCTKFNNLKSLLTACNIMIETKTVHDNN